MSVVNRLLHKLLEEAPAEAVEAEVVAFLGQLEAMAFPERSDAMADLEVVLELRGLVERLRRRSRELRALFETAGDLSAMRDVESVLQAIVKRGRQLLNSDVAYLMMVDEEHDDTYMRVTEGTTSKGFGDIRLPLGAGLGGQVAQRRAPMWTRNYHEDQGYVHVIDGVVEDEKLVAILGVPLQVGTRLLGVLFAADRTDREFSTDEVSLLGSLAHHAAIAIENASLFQENQDALAALYSANSVIERNNARLEQAIDLHERLMRLVVAGGELQEIADAVGDVLGGTVVVWDHRPVEIARSASPDDREWSVDQLLAQFPEGDPADEIVRLTIGPRHEAVIAPIVAAGNRLGTMAFLGRQIRDDDVRALERGAGVIAVLLLNRRAHDEADNRVRGEILAELLMRAPRDEAVIRRRASLLGVDLEQPLVILVLVPDPGTVTRGLQMELSQLVRDAGGLAASYADRVVVTVPVTWAAQPAVEMASRLSRMRVTVGAAGPTSDLADLIPLEDRARRSAKLLIALGRTGEGIASDDLGIYGLLLSEADQAHVHSFIESCLGPVRAYDAARKTALLATMEQYFASEANVSATGEAMFIHVNTVYQRLERLDRLLGQTWRSGDRGLEIRLALRLDRLMRDDA